MRPFRAVSLCGDSPRPVARWASLAPSGPPWRGRTGLTQMPGTNNIVGYGKKLENLMSRKSIDFFKKEAGKTHSSDAPDDASILPGKKPVLEQLERRPEQVERVFVQQGRQGRDVDRLLALCRKNGVQATPVPIAALERMCPGGAHQGVAARLASVGFMELEELLERTLAAPLPVALALDQLQDPGNVGTLARTLYALGGEGLIMPRHESAHLGPVAAKASAGALPQLALSRVSNLSRALEKATEMGFTVYLAAAGEEGINAFEASLRLPAVLVLGNEEKGVRPGVAKRCHVRLDIPMAREFDSLNVAQAGAILLSRFAPLVRLSGHKT